MTKSSNQLPKLVVAAYNLRSSHNVGSLFRTCEGLAVNQLLLCGYTPYPKAAADTRLPHIAAKVDAQIAKTALGAQLSLPWRHCDDITDPIALYRSQGYQVIALEQAAVSVNIRDFKPTTDLLLIIGNELTGLDSSVLTSCDIVIEIPMLGKKESFNVVQATAMALFSLRLAT